MTNPFYLALALAVSLIGAACVGDDSGDGTSSADQGAATGGQADSGSGGSDAGTGGGGGTVGIDGGTEGGITQPGTDVAETDTGTTQPDTAPPDQTFAGAPLASLSDGECPDLSRSGTTTFSSAGVVRTVVVSLPDSVRPGLPALTLWHGLGDSAQSMSAWMRMPEFARTSEVVVVVPDSVARDSTTWDILGGGGADLVLYDDIRTCLSRDLDIDLGRYYASGFSFGGLWTTFLTTRRADTLATTLPFSGGTAFWNPYQTPEWQIPVLLAWGGEADQYGSGPQTVRFADTSAAFSDALVNDGHFVVHCDHGGGHSVPADGAQFFGPWLLAHRYGQPSPFASGTLEGFPDYCYVP